MQPLKIDGYEIGNGYLGKNEEQMIVISLFCSEGKSGHLIREREGKWNLSRPNPDEAAHEKRNLHLRCA